MGRKSLGLVSSIFSFYFLVTPCFLCTHNSPALIHTNQIPLTPSSHRKHLIVEDEGAALVKPLTSSLTTATGFVYHTGPIQIFCRKTNPLRNCLPFNWPNLIIPNKIMKSASGIKARASKSYLLPFSKAGSYD